MQLRWQNPEYRAWHLAHSKEYIKKPERRLANLLRMRQYRAEKRQALLDERAQEARDLARAAEKAVTLAAKARLKAERAKADVEFASQERQKSKESGEPEHPLQDSCASSE